MSRRRLAAVAVLAVLTGTAAACGVPTGGAPATIPPSEVPYGLASRSPATSAPPSVVDGTGQPQVWLVGADGALVPRSRELAAGTGREELAELLDDLSAGPSRAELADRLSSALPPDLGLAVAGVSDGTVTIELDGAADAPAGRASRRAVGQIVLTATSLPWVDDVLLSHGGEQLDAPLPSGELTAAPLTSADYQPLRTPSASPTSAPAPTS